MEIIVSKKDAMKMNGLGELQQIREFSLGVWKDKSSTWNRGNCVINNFMTHDLIIYDL